MLFRRKVKKTNNKLGTITKRITYPMCAGEQISVECSTSNPRLPKAPTVTKPLLHHQLILSFPGITMKDCFAGGSHTSQVFFL